MSSTRPARTSFLSFQPPAVGEEEIEAVADALRSGWLTTGPRAAELERRFADYVGVKHALAVSSGTAAMHLSLAAAGIGPGDEVITTPITWPATANVIVHTGATPVFCDVRDSDLNIDPEAIEAAATGRTRAVMPVDLAGQPSDLGPIMSLAREHGWLVVEDAAHAVESEYRGQKVGAVADATCFSLYATKNVAAGEGGVITTDLDDLADEVRELRLTRRGHGSLYDIRTAGFKANLADLNAAVALCQLDKLDQHRQIRLRHVAALRRGDRRPRRHRVARPGSARHARPAPLCRSYRRRAGRRESRRLPGGARRREHRHEHSLPSGASPDVLPRARSHQTSSGGGEGRLGGAVAPALACARQRRHRRRDRRAPARAPEVCRPVSRLPRPVSISLKILLSVGVIAYLVWQINIGQTVKLIGSANGLYLLAALAIFLATTVGMAWRWQMLLAAKGIVEPLGWLTKLYFIGNAAGQVLPTGVGGDAARIIEHSRRKPEHKGEVAGAVILERVIGAAGNARAWWRSGSSSRSVGTTASSISSRSRSCFLALVAAGFVLLFSKRAAVLLRAVAPFASKIRLERAGRAVYRAMHAIARQPGALVVVLVVTVVMQFFRTSSRSGSAGLPSASTSRRSST